MKIVVCHTEGCPNRGVKFSWDYDTAVAEAKAQGSKLSNPWCGGCSQPITDITTKAGTSPGDGGFTPT